ncbi:MAG TPA: ATP-binding protein [Trueperaceae bacterium]|nr:ATP-binding protein [Trueperaceae bacterium]
MTPSGPGGSPGREGPLAGADNAWFDALAEGVVLVTTAVVLDLNAAAASLLDVTREAARGAPLMSVLRDHRLERLATAAGAGERAAHQVELRGKAVEAVVVPGALLLRDRSEVAIAKRDARELLAVLSHELRTPVAVIRAVLEALAGGPSEDADAGPGGPESAGVGAIDNAGAGSGSGSRPGPGLDEQRKTYFLRRAIGEAERLTRLLSDLTVDVRPPRERTVELGAAIARAVAVTESVQRRHAVSVGVLPSALAVWVDEDKLLQALVNLVENAVVHGREGGQVEVAARAEGSLAVVEVRDEGSRLAPELIETLFEPRAQGGGKNKGTGLGLRIVRSLATGWGGAAWGGARSDSRPGNAFMFSVPLADSR